MSKVFIASDHAGFELKEKLKDYFMNLEWVDLGTKNTDRVDYPDYASLLAEKLKEESESFGVLVCGSGQGMAMRANKYSHIRAALCYDTKITKLSRQHNNANVLCLGERMLNSEAAIEILKCFLATEFEGGRHQERVKKISDVT